MAISTNQKPTIYRNLYDNTAPLGFDGNAFLHRSVHKFGRRKVVYIGVSLFQRYTNDWNDTPS